VAVSSDVEEWRRCFSEQEREIARDRVAEYGYTAKGGGLAVERKRNVTSENHHRIA
jgi:hypothetical protein